MSELEHALSEVVRNVVREELAQLPLPQEPASQVWYSVRQAAEYTGTTVYAVRKAYQSGALERSTRGKGSVSFSRQALDAWNGGGS